MKWLKVIQYQVQQVVEMVRLIKWWIKILAAEESNCCNFLKNYIFSLFSGLGSLRKLKYLPFKNHM